MEVLEFDAMELPGRVSISAEQHERRRLMTLFVERADSDGRHGGVGYVVKARNAYGEEFALKRPNPGASASTAYSSQMAASLKQEFEAHRRISNTGHVPRIYGLGTARGESAIVMEWVQGETLSGVLKQRENVPLPLIAAVGICTLRALLDIQHVDASLVHRDISPANIMLRTSRRPLEEQLADGDLDICLIDFGSATIDEGAEAGFTEIENLWRGATPEYAAPEMLGHDDPKLVELRRSPAIDVYALCSVLYQLYSSNTPFALTRRQDARAYHVKMNEQPTALQAREGDEQGKLAAAIMSGLAREQAARPTAEALLSALEAWLSAAQPEAPALTPRPTAPDGESGQEPDVTPQTGGSHVMLAAQSDPVHVADVLGSEPQKKQLSRRRFLALVGAVAGAALCGTGVAAYIGTRGEPKLNGYAINEGSVAGELWSGAQLYPARAANSSTWYLRSFPGANVELDNTGHEPGRFVGGLVKAFDAASGGYGFKTAVENATGLECAWGIGRTFAQAKDFSTPAGNTQGPENRLAPVEDPDRKLWGFIDARGNDRIGALYADANRFSNGYAAVRSNSGERLWGMVDHSGAEVLAPAFYGLGLCSDEGIMAAAPGAPTSWVFVGVDGAQVFDGTFSQVRRFTEGLAGVRQDPNGLWGFIDSSGAQAIEARFLDVRPFCDGLAPAQDAESHLWGLIDTSGTWQGKRKASLLSIGEKVGDLFPAHGSPAHSYDLDSKRWTAWVDDAENSDYDFGYSYIDTRGAWVVNPTYADTLIRASEQ